MNKWSALTVVAALECCLAVPSLPLAQPAPFTGWASVVEANKNATALIRVETLGRDPSYGSGVVMSDEGHIVTAKHILPSVEVRDRGEFMIISLIGWDNPSVEFSGATRLDIQYISPTYDLAILRLRQPLPKGVQPAFGTPDVRQGEPLLVMGYPDGGNLISTAGIASGQASDGRYATDASVGIGSSGGPVFGASGAVLGIILEGSRRDSEGRIILGYFLRTQTIAEDLITRNAGVQFPTGPGKLAGRRLEQLEFAYPVSQLKDDHAYFPDSRNYDRSFPAQQGFRITGARFVADSANHVTKGPDVEIVDNGQRVVVRFSLESGPFFDRWRGWLSGNVVTTQRRSPSLQ
jgi:S1-C subfamily serine protease